MHIFWFDYTTYRYPVKATFQEKLCKKQRNMVKKQREPAESDKTNGFGAIMGSSKNGLDSAGGLRYAPYLTMEGRKMKVCFYGNTGHFFTQLSIQGLVDGIFWFPYFAYAMVSPLLLPPLYRLTCNCHPRDISA